MIRLLLWHLWFSAFLSPDLSRSKKLFIMLHYGNGKSYPQITNTEQTVFMRTATKNIDIPCVHLNHVTFLLILSTQFSFPTAKADVLYIVFFLDYSHWIS